MKPDNMRRKLRKTLLPTLSAVLVYGAFEAVTRLQLDDIIGAVEIIVASCVLQVLIVITYWIIDNVLDRLPYDHHG